MADIIFNNFKKLIMSGGIDLDTDVIKVALVTASYTPDQDSHDFWNDVSANEISGTGYTAGGASIANPAVTADNTDNEGVFDGDDVSWSSSTITARGAVIYKYNATAASAPLIAYLDFTADKSSSSSTFQVTWNAEGILNLN